MTSLPKQWQNSDFHDTKQIIYHLKGIDEGYPKMYFLLNLSHYVKSYGHFCQFFHMVMSRDPRNRFGKFFHFVLVLHLILGKVTKFLVEKLSTSEAINQKHHGGWKHPQCLWSEQYKVYLRSASTQFFFCLNELKNKYELVKNLEGSNCV